MENWLAETRLRLTERTIVNGENKRKVHMLEVQGIGKSTEDSAPRKELEISLKDWRDINKYINDILFEYEFHVDDT